ncbi:MAG TPA: dephospho-CoA kinase [Longimicrobiales bacterium]|nr:dephospho-CoA kinase [Longimicrobiales bacterium]
MSRLYRVGLTGNIAAGKSSVANAWRALGAAVVDADVLAREAVAPGSPGLARVVEAFGPDVLDRDGALDRAALRRVVFADPAARRTLEAITHPEIARLRDEADARLERAGERIVVHDIPLLFEVGLEDAFDLLVLVDAPEAVRRERIVRERALPEAEAQAMIAAQMPAEAKRARADIVIDNAGTPAGLQREAEQVWRRILDRAAASG